MNALSLPSHNKLGIITYLGSQIPQKNTYQGHHAFQISASAVEDHAERAVAVTQEHSQFETAAWHGTILAVVTNLETNSFSRRQFLVRRHGHELFSLLCGYEIPMPTDIDRMQATLDASYRVGTVQANMRHRNRNNSSNRQW